MKKASPLIAPRIKTIIEIKKSSSTGISKRVLASMIGADPNSIQTWRSLYFKGGIDAILKHNKKGFKPSIL